MCNGIRPPLHLAWTDSDRWPLAAVNFAGRGDGDIPRDVELGVVEENTRCLVRRRAGKFDQDPARTATAARHAGVLIEPWEFSDGESLFALFHSVISFYSNPDAMRATVRFRPFESPGVVEKLGCKFRYKGRQ
ncbi:hypothetical protein C8F04DRAFT_1182862 [Mycena alexandri]|uniref:Uncharacterized protein n=1 Tax=Mycena alexandri TaxID=1745969 RepID=A0AAD6SW29_9AGAR|nr:hypothetical protein C8F04DRAFT_1182862 [Mycena alexandri]